MKAVAILGLALPLVAAKVSYDGYKAFRINNLDNWDATERTLTELEYVSLSCEHNHQTLDVAIAPEHLDAFNALNLDATVVTEDVGAELAAEGELQPYTASRRLANETTLPDPAYFESYHVFEEHLQFLDDLQAAFPHNSQIFVAGESLEGRPIQGIHIWGSCGPGKQAIVWQANVHAREWITGMTVEYMTYQLIQGYQRGDAIPRSTLNRYDFYVLPIVNPDGFVYTSTDNRLWRKNRQSRAGESCVGTDLNRNWPHQWDVPGGASEDPCSDAYRGEGPGDTPEMAVLSNFTRTLGETTGIKLFIDWHAYSQLILLPYSYSCTAEAENIDQQLELAGGVAAAIQGVNGLEFVYGPTCQVIYQASGSSMDFVLDIAGAELAWGFELRPASGSAGGFVIPASNIVPSGEENWAGMEYLFSVF
ncbi:hypothetical protein S7711_02652 [Stachybotrys chartarum IBT 7711]|uniref:Peptidase M14 domain-containing protein n=1 Tax=Stachybotrys chartarum (strain CBS 109288 / IBT 7711) TaxID=1280523 RepID=A0A084B933_STACB|nr:hypothetical protein S7711_02652 [Stachybotrys chartarum IBT 7711]KFA48764.1 hypothetical protein S40293_01484 [Stachybotrys chartarum IBT 40293]KFA80536.1 hypothetical protein S40288_07210 [Stachybotrys chartarum IBT 40288]